MAGRNETMLPMGTSMGMKMKFSQEETPVLFSWPSQGAFDLDVCPRSADDGRVYRG